MMKKYNSEKEQIDAAWNKLEPLLEENTPVQVKLRSFISNKKIMAAAAVLLIVTTALLFKEYNSSTVYTTKYGETTRIVLPDSSVIFLNGNSRLSFRKNWPVSGDREVKISGEAYFSVRHTKTDQKFFVRMDEGLSVEVLGTQFNVSNRKTETNVVLSSGKIRFHMDEVKADETDTVTMKPGDLVAYKSTSKTYIKRAVDPEIYSSWKSSRLVFDKTELKDVLLTIQNTYGLHIKVESPELLHMRVSGSAPTQNIDLLISGLSEIFHLDLIRKGDTLTVKSK
jgi:transmembrane sensor